MCVYQWLIEWETHEAQMSDWEVSFRRRPPDNFGGGDFLFEI